MINNLSVIAIIPARGGSKGLPAKNIRFINGKPLIAWSIEQALASKTIDRVIVSSDCTETMEIAKAYGAEVPFVRPSNLAQDESTTVDVLLHAHDILCESEHSSYHYSVLLEPTAPIREKDDIDSMVTKLNNLEDQFDAIVSIGEVSEHPSIMKKYVGEVLNPYMPDNDQGSRRQDYDSVFWPYGGLFVNKTKVMIEEKALYTKRLTYYKLKKYQCCEIDDLFDFVKTEAVMKHVWIN